MFGLSTRTLIIAGAVLAIVAGFGVYTKWVFNQGVSSERRQQVETSLDRNAQRNKDDAELRNSDLYGLCREYGATRWVPAQNRCE